MERSQKLSTMWMFGAPLDQGRPRVGGGREGGTEIWAVGAVDVFTASCDVHEAVVLLMAVLLNISCIPRPSFRPSFPTSLPPSLPLLSSFSSPPSLPSSFPLSSFSFLPHSLLPPFSIILSPYLPIILSPSLPSHAPQ